MVEPVRRICRRIAESIDHNFPTYVPADDIFDAYHGLALLGKKEEALKRLQAIYDRYPKKAYFRSTFEWRLDEARKW